MKDAYAYVFPLLIVLIILLANNLLFTALAQSPGSENDTYPMALQRIPTKNLSDAGSENDTYPMALQRIPTKNLSDAGSENDTYPMALQRIPTSPKP